MTTRTQVQRHFDDNVNEYADKYIEAYARICTDRLATLQTLFNSVQPLNVLDVGCGAGFFSDLVLARFPNARVYSLDCSFGMLRRNSVSVRKHSVQADCTQLPFVSKVFDVINIDTVMHHLISHDSYA